MRERSFRIRAARPDDFADLAAVERSAAGLFRAAGLGWIADSPTLPVEMLERYRAAGTLWVGADADDRPAGFLAATAQPSLPSPSICKVSSWAPGTGLATSLHLPSCL